MMTGDAGMPPKTDTIAAIRWTGAMDAEGFPPDAAWETVPGVQSDWDWQGANADPTRETPGFKVPRQIKVECPIVKRKSV